MDKVEYKILTEEIKKLINKGEFVKAVQIADRIDWNKVHSIMMLCTISDLYKANRRFEDAKDLLYLAYKRSPNSRTILYSLCDLSIKLEEFISAIEYYKAFVEVAPKDSGRYVLQYRLFQAQDASIEERIEVLVELKKKEYIEKWAYELAYLYHRIGFATECVDECDELILWFGEGKYVNKAMELKMLHQPLTESQEYKYQHRFDHLDDGHGMTRVLPRVEVVTGNEKFVPVVDSPTVEIPSESIAQELKEAEQISVKVLDVHNIYSTMNLEKELANSLKAVYDSNEEKVVEAAPIVPGAITEEVVVEEELEETVENIIEELVEESSEATIEGELEETEEYVFEGTIEDLIVETDEAAEEILNEDIIEENDTADEEIYLEGSLEEFAFEDEEDLAGAMSDALDEEIEPEADIDCELEEVLHEVVEDIVEEVLEEAIETVLEEAIETVLEEALQTELTSDDLFNPTKGNLLVIASDVKARDQYIHEYIDTILDKDTAADGVMFLTGFKLNRHYKQYFQEMNEKKVVVISSVDTLRDELVDALWEYLDHRQEPLQMIFTDKKKTIQKVYAKHKKIKKYFSKVVELEEVLIADLVDYAIKYAYEQEYSLDEMAVLAIETLLEADQVANIALSYENVEELVNTAITRVKKKSLSHFLDVLLKRRYDKEDMIILKEQYFWN